MPTKTLRQKIEKVLADVTPMLGLHGGSVELVKVTADNVAQVRFKGACIGCAAADMTLEYGLKEMIMLQVEEVEDVIALNDEPITHLPPKIQPQSN